MTDAIRVSSPITGTDKTMSFEAGHLAQLADGAVLARLGDTMLLAAHGEEGEPVILGPAHEVPPGAKIT